MSRFFPSSSTSTTLYSSSESEDYEYNEYSCSPTPPGRNLPLAADLEDLAIQAAIATSLESPRLPSPPPPSPLTDDGAAPPPSPSSPTLSSNSVATLLTLISRLIPNEHLLLANVLNDCLVQHHTATELRILLTGHDQLATLITAILKGTTPSSHPDSSTSCEPLTPAALHSALDAATPAMQQYMICERLLPRIMHLIPNEPPEFAAAIMSSLLEATDNSSLPSLLTSPDSLKAAVTLRLKAAPPAALSNATPAMQQYMIGEALYPRVYAKLNAAELAGTITSSLLTSGTEALLHLLADPAELNSRIALEAARLQGVFGRWWHFSRHLCRTGTIRQLLRVCRKLTSSAVSVGHLLSYYPAIRLGGARQDVFLGRLSTGKACAIKKTPRSIVDSTEDEARVLMELAHKHIVKLYHHETTNPEYYFMALELCHGTLDGLATRNLDFAASKAIIHQTLQAVDFLHNEGIAHRDLKPSNVLYVQTIKGISVRVADFGISKKLDEAATSYTMTHAGAGGTKGYQSQEFVQYKNGFLPYWRPTNDDYKKGDMFALGLVIHSLLCSNKHPFSHPTKPNREEIRIEDGERPNLSLLNNMFEAQHIVGRCIEHDPAHRLNASECLSHPLFYSPRQRLQEINRVFTRAKDKDVAARMGLHEKSTWKEAFKDCEEKDGTLLTGNYNNKGEGMIRFLRNIIEHSDEYDRTTKLQKSFRAHVRNWDTLPREEMIARWIEVKKIGIWCRIYDVQQTTSRSEETYGK